MSTSKKQPASYHHILLCGFMAAGKSSIGRVLARRLDKPFFDLDQIIETGEKKTISEIFSGHGEEYFRKLERRYMSELEDLNPSVISLGGGALQNEQIVNNLKAKNVLIYLNAPMTLIIRRLRKSKTRPMLYNEDGSERDINELKTYLYSLHKKREKLYKQAHLCLNISPDWNKTTIVTHVIDYLRTHAPSD